MPPDESNPLSKRFRIQIEKANNELEQCVAPIVSHNNLSMHKENDRLVIY